MAGADARLVGGGVAPGQSPSQLTPLGGTYKKPGGISYNVNYRAGSVAKSLIVSETISTGKGLRLKTLLY